MYGLESFAQLVQQASHGALIVPGAPWYIKGEFIIRDYSISLLLFVFVNRRNVIGINKHSQYYITFSYNYYNSSS